jgi:glutamate synthase domain-containing protein 1
MKYTPFKMKYKNLEEVVEGLQNASKMHKKQSKVVQNHIDEMKEKSPLEKRGSWEYGGKTYYGDYIREDSKYTYYRTHNNKIKKKPKRS